MMVRAGNTTLKVLSVLRGSSEPPAARGGLLCATTDQLLVMPGVSERAKRQ
jgi:hypothetical protein